MERSLAASPRRISASRQSGQLAHSRLLPWAGAVGGAALAGWQARSVVAAAVAHDLRNVTAAEPDLTTAWHRTARIALTLGGSLACAAAIGALLVHLLVVRSAWLPKRHIDHAPTISSNSLTRARSWLGWSLASAGVFGGLLGWLWLSAPVLAATLHSRTPTPSVITNIALRALVSTVAIAVLVLGIAHWLWRWWLLAQAQRMTVEEVQREQRESAPAPAIRNAAKRAHANAQVAPTIVVYDHARAVAIAWDPAHVPVPCIVWQRTGAAGQAAVRLAQQHGTHVRHAPALVAQVAPIAVGNTVPKTAWPALARLIAALAQA